MKWVGLRGDWVSGLGKRGRCGDVRDFTSAGAVVIGTWLRLNGSEEGLSI